MKTLYGVGVGPGDPELLTVKAARCLREAQHIFVPRTRPDEAGLAETIVQDYLAGKHVVACYFPMGADNAGRYIQIAQTFASVIQADEVGVFVTLGDPLLYSTYAYTLREAQKLGIAVKTIPGITALTAAAAALTIPIAIKDESVYITDGQLDDEILARVQTVCVFKARRNAADTLEKLEQHGFQYTCVKHCSLPQQAILSEKEAIVQDCEYLSVIFAKKTASCQAGQSLL